MKYAGRVRALLINHNRVNVRKKDGTDGRTEKKLLLYIQRYGCGQRSNWVRYSWRNNEAQRMIPLSDDTRILSYKNYKYKASTAAINQSSQIDKASLCVDGAGVWN